MKKIRSGQPAIPVMNWVKHKSFPVSTVKTLELCKLRIFKKISEMLGFDGECLAGHAKFSYETFHRKTCFLSFVKTCFLSFVNLCTSFCSKL